MNSTFIFYSELTVQAKPFHVLHCTHLLLCLTEWCCQRGIQTNVLQMSNEELDESLRRFYAEARTQTGQEYSRSSLLGFRNSIERHFIANNGRSLKLTGNPVFAQSNKMLESKLKALRREGKENVQHKAVIESKDLIKLNNSPFMSPNTPAGLLRKVWFFCTLYWCRRGSEGQRLLRRDSFHLEKDADGIDYVTMSHEELSKNHQGGFADKSSEERQTRLYSTGQDGDAFSCFRKYLDKLNPRQQAFFQKPRAKFEQSNQVWFENKPFGVNQLSMMMKQISIGAGLSKKYTNHCVRATAITLWSDSCVPARHIMSISGHANEQSLASYNRRPSTSQLKNCSDILSHALQKGRAPEQTATAVASFPTSSSSTITSTAVAQIPADSSVQGIFNSCNIGQAQVFILSQNASKSTFQ